MNEKWTNGNAMLSVFDSFALSPTLLFFSLCYECINISCFVRFCWPCKVGELWNDIWVCKSALNICIRCVELQKKAHFCRQFQYTAKKRGILHVTLTCMRERNARTDSKLCFTEKTRKRRTNFGISHPAGTMVSTAQCNTDTGDDG